MICTLIRFAIVFSLVGAGHPEWAVIAYLVLTRAQQLLDNAMKRRLGLQ